MHDLRDEEVKVLEKAAAAPSGKQRASPLLVAVSKALTKAARELRKTVRCLPSFCLLCSLGWAQSAVFIAAGSGPVLRGQSLVAEL